LDKSFYRVLSSGVPDIQQSLRLRNGKDWICKKCIHQAESQSRSAGLAQPPAPFFPQVLETPGSRDGILRLFSDAAQEENPVPFIAPLLPGSSTLLFSLPASFSEPREIVEYLFLPYEFKICTNCG